MDGEVDKERAVANLRAFLEPDVSEELKALLGTVREFSGATLAMMQLTRNEWLRRVPPEQMKSDYFATLSWLYIQCAPEMEVRRVVFDEMRFRDAVWAWSLERPQGTPRINERVLSAANAIIKLELGLIEAAQISVLDKPGETKEAAPPNS